MTLLAAALALALGADPQAELAAAQARKAAEEAAAHTLAAKETSVLGGALASGALLALVAAALPRVVAALGVASPIARGDVLPPVLLAGLVAGGGMLGTIASALAVGRELRQKRP